MRHGNQLHFILLIFFEKMVDKLKDQNSEQEEEHPFSMQEIRENLYDIEIRSNPETNTRVMYITRQRRNNESIINGNYEEDENHNVNRRLDFS